MYENNSIQMLLKIVNFFFFFLQRSHCTISVATIKFAPEICTLRRSDRYNRSNVG